ncbi:MAG: 4'-phosphopantetheinyl transferase superfamily protein [Hydrococcus sp. CRU_1_1]|nr:4'-phosphopantetheinyl transferase superfamily protein [Hydrococcus sp. CRU_1_1]NJQ97755.1 4'-phosphopantetheinyl transferase superfamily protein [Hydrococcus sp. CSU_1_8]
MTDSSLFSLPPCNLCSPSSKTVHLWRSNLDVPIERVRELATILSDDERARAERFYFELHRNRFIVSRGGLRTILGRYLNLKPDRVQFEYSSRGKPKLAESGGAEKLQFNVSHSQDLALYGFSCDRAIGVDLEYLRRFDDAQNIARRFFSAQESAIIDSLPEEEKIAAFFRGWTGKEAYLKATGEGLAGSLDAVEVSLVPSEPVRLLALNGDSQAAARWHLHSFIPAVDYIATVAIEGHLQFTINNYQFILDC